jgi:hypothetical protein
MFITQGSGCNFNDVLTLIQSKEDKKCMQNMQLSLSMNSIYGKEDNFLFSDFTIKEITSQSLSNHVIQDK